MEVAGQNAKAKVDLAGTCYEVCGNATLCNKEAGNVADESFEEHKTTLEGMGLSDRFDSMKVVVDFVCAGPDMDQPLDDRCRLAIETNFCFDDDSNVEDIGN